MKIVILNSGIGERMGSLTKKNPKCLVKINGGTILGHQVRNLTNNGMNNIIITTGPFENKIKNFMKNKFPKLNIVYINNPKYAVTNYIYSIHLLRNFIDDDIILLHGDMIFEESVLKKLINSKYRNGVLVNRTIAPPEKDFKARVENNLVKEIKIDISGKNCFFLAPIYKFSKKYFQLLLREIEKYVRNKKTNIYAENALNNLLEQAKIKPIYFRDEFCMEIDNPDDLRIARDFFRKFREDGT